MLRFWIALLLVLFAAPTLAADWSHNNRIKPGENRNYEFTVDESSSMLDARACATTVFSWNQDIEGTQTTGESTLYSCPKADSVTANCDIVSMLKDNEVAMAVSEKPGFFFVDPTEVPTGSAVSRVTAFCAREFVRNPNYVRKTVVYPLTTLPFGPGFQVPFNQPGYTRGYFVLEFTNTTGGASTQVLLENTLTGDLWRPCVFGSAVVADQDFIVVMGGEGYEAANGVNEDCNRPFSKDIVFNINVSIGGSVDLQIWFYGVPI